MPSEKVQSKKWADDSDEEDETPSETFEDGIKTITEIKTNDKGQKVKIIKKIKVYTKTVTVNKNVEARKKWKKFGECAGAGPGLEAGITSESLEEINLTLGGPTKEESAPVPTASATAVCRNCGRNGDHWTLQCPYKSAEAREKEEDERNSINAVGGKKKSVYVPPRMRGGDAGAAAPDDDGGRGRRGDDFPTVRVTNLSEDTKESDLAELFRPFGPISRIYLAKDKDSNVSRGFAFVSFIRKEDAARAIDKLSGHGYDHLILHLEWAKPSK